MVDSYDIRKPFGPQSFIVQSLYGFTGDVTFNVKPLNGTNGKKYYVSRLLYHNLSYLEEVGFNPYEGTDPAKKKQVIEVTLPTAVATSGIAVLSATINSQDVNVVIPGGLTEQGVLKFPVDFAVTALGDTVSKQKDSLLARQIVVNGETYVKTTAVFKMDLTKTELFGSSYSTLHIDYRTFTPSHIYSVADAGNTYMWGKVQFLDIASV